ncbi:glycosyltransferase [Henriciella sp.]|uniref:glycosyltransferase n=1 Tax=Henriciella sp. TaxID=1968823 RepID=UPI002632A672|nr:glycosyltransferase [Henriciella sp.]
MKLAISVPVGAWHDFLPWALESLACQKADLRIAFLDASGDPRVKALADQYDDRLAYRRHGPDGGQSDAILEGWANVEGDWLGWLNADDMLMPGALEKVQAHLGANPGLEAVYGHSVILDGDGAMTGYHFNVEPPGERLLQAGIISQPSCFFSRAAYERAGGLNRDLHYVMDWDLWIRMYKSGTRFGFLDDALSMVIWADDTKTASINKRRRSELNAVIAEHAPEAAQKATFRAFMVHAAADKLWPPSLRRALVRRLRRSGPSVFGLRADGAFSPEADLKLAHYASEAKSGLRLSFLRPAPSLKASALGREVSVSSKGATVELRFDRPLGPAELCDINLRHDAGEAPVFLKAEWL